MFNQPQSSSGYFKPAEHANHLVLITTVHSSDRKYDQLRKEELDEFVVDIVDIDGDQQLQERVLISHKGITSRFTVGSTLILGRIGQVDTKSGFQAWALLPFNEGTDDAKAEAWVMANRPTFNQAAAAPAPAPVNTTTGEVASGVNLNDPAVQALLAQMQTTPAAAAPAASNPPF